MKIILRSLLFPLLILLRLRGIICLKMLSLDVPSSVMVGESFWLNCTLDLESDDLYSVKWYKNEAEFYRHLPRDNPAGLKFDVPGIHLDLDKSGPSHIFLKNADVDTEGLYKCEASAESPSFQTVMGQKQLKVYVLPQEGPKIVGSRLKYEVGDYVNVTCKSGPSKPKAFLKWYINGKEARPGLEISYPAVEHENGLQTSYLGLAFMVNPEHLFQGDALTLRCTATVSQTYSTSSEELIVGERFTDTSSPMNTLTVIDDDGPMISGGKANYRNGDLLNVNCSSSKSRPAPQLHWYLNDKMYCGEEFEGTVYNIHKTDRIVDNCNRCWTYHTTRKNKFVINDESLIFYPKILYPDGEETAVLGLRLRVQSFHLDDTEQMKLKCTATLSRVINVRSEERTLGGNHRNSGLQVAENYGKVSERNRCSRNCQNILNVVFLLGGLITLL